MKIKIDLNKKKGQFNHFWEKIVGSGHMSLLLRHDLSEHFKMAKEDLGFQYFRCHGVLNDDMNILVCENKIDNDEIDPDDLNFFNIDEIMDYMLKIGIKPFLELSFMPSQLASGDQTVFFYKANVTPPSSYKAWGSLIKQLIEHFIERYGIEEVRTWYFELWNEPNLNEFWAGTMEDYFRLYKETASAIKGIDKQLRIGGPATAKFEWIKEFIDYCFKNNLPIDFFSGHLYLSEKPKPREGATQQGQNQNYFQQKLKEIKELIDSSAYKNTPIFVTEYNSSTIPYDINHDLPIQSAFIVNQIINSKDYVDGMAYWTVSDVFEETGFPDSEFHGGFGLITINGIKKPSWRAYQILHMLNDTELDVEIIEGKFNEKQGIIATTNKEEDSLEIIVWNNTHTGSTYSSQFNTNPHSKDKSSLIKADFEQNEDKDNDNEKDERPNENNENKENEEIKNDKFENLSIEIFIQNLPEKFTRSHLETTLIDEYHSNPYNIWTQMGSPRSPTPNQHHKLKFYSKRSYDILNMIIRGGKCEIILDLFPEGISFLRLIAPKTNMDFNEF
ncbi:MAG: GH39 family glycosyl hydrolase [Promethearchaeota archaeon]